MQTYLEKVAVSFSPDRIWLAMTVMLVMVWPANQFALKAVAEEDLPSAVEYGTPKKLCKLQSRSIRESSGIAASRSSSNWFWTHNDSGDRARIFAFDTGGNHLGTCQLEGAKAIDWEDMASFELDEQSYLLLADVGDNAARRKNCVLYLVVERSPVVERWDLSQAVRFTYEDRPHDCESIGFDSTLRQVLLVTKDWNITSQVFALDWPTENSQEVLIAKKIGTLPYPGVTAMDVSPDGNRAIVLTYADAFEYSRANEETWAEAFSRAGRPISMPDRGQGEAICYGLDGWTLYLTSEATPTPLYRVSVKD